MKIPKRMFFFYSRFTLPWMRWMSLFSFRKLNPDWEMVLVAARDASYAEAVVGGERTDPAGLPAPERHTYDQLRIALWGVDMDRGRTIPQAADLQKWRTLERYGGWFADTDILWIDSMESVVKECDGADVAISAGRWGGDGLALVGSVRRSGFAAEMLKAASLPQSKRFASSGGDALLKVLGLQSGGEIDAKNLATSFGSKFPDQTLTIMPATTVCPWDVSQISSIFDSDLPVPEVESKNPPVIGIHWHGSNPTGQHCLKTLTADNFRAPENVNTFTHYARNLIEDSND